MEENQSQEATKATQSPELTITDLANLRSIIDVAVRRGVFAANEISAVGATYDKINAFVNAVTTTGLRQGNRQNSPNCQETKLVVLRRPRKNLQLPVLREFVHCEPTSVQGRIPSRAQSWHNVDSRQKI
jgi:hypothetical protein